MIDGDSAIGIVIREGLRRPHETGETSCTARANPAQELGSSKMINQNTTPSGRFVKGNFERSYRREGWKLHVSQDAKAHYIMHS